MSEHILHLYLLGQTRAVYPGGDQEKDLRVQPKPLQLLAYLQDERGIQPQTFWSQDLAEGEALDSLYLKFAEWVSQPLNVTVPELKEKGDTVGVAVGDGPLANKRRKGETQTWIDGLKQLKGSLPPEAWTPAISTDGWNIAGPDTDWPP